MIENETLIAENVEVDMEVIRLAQNFNAHPLARLQALNTIGEAVVNAL